jgi:hypothetical protein
LEGGDLRRAMFIRRQFGNHPSIGGRRRIG